MKRFFKLMGCGALAIIGVLLVLAFIGRDSGTAAAPTADDPNLASYAKTCQMAKAMGSGVDVFDCIEQMKEGAAEAQKEAHRSAEDCAWYQARLDDPLVDAAHKADYRRSMKKGGCKLKGGK